jgi:hypothetical protein
MALQVQPSARVSYIEPRWRTEAGSLNDVELVHYRRLFLVCDVACPIQRRLRRQRDRGIPARNRN